MSDLARPRPSLYAVLTWTALAAVLGGFALVCVLPSFAQARFTLRAPDWGLLLAQKPAVLVHLAAITPAVGIGFWQLLEPKGTLSHRTLGWIWSALMLATAVSSLFVRQLNEGGFSYIHLLSAYVLIVLPIAVWAARTHRVALHRRMMTGLVLGGTLIAASSPCCRVA